VGKIFFVSIVFVALILGIVTLLSRSNTPPLTQASPTPLTAISPTVTSSPFLASTPTDVPTAIPKQPILAQTATIHTEKGDIVLSLYTSDAPNTVINFVKKAAGGYYNNLTFHRVEDWVIQGGDPKGDGTGGGNMTTELNNKPFVTGSLGVARAGDIRVSNDSQFFITKNDAPSLNGQYTNFGMVTSGMDVVSKIAIGDKILGITVQ